MLIGSLPGIVIGSYLAGRADGRGGARDAWLSVLVIVGVAADGLEHRRQPSMLGAHDLPIGELLQHRFGQLLRRPVERVQMDLGIFRRLVGRVDAGEILESARLRLGIEALRIALRCSPRSACRRRPR